MKEKWVENIMQSIDSLESVDVSDNLNARILQQIPALQTQIVALSKPTKWAMAACIVLLIGLNSMTIVHYNRMKRTDTNAKNKLYEEYFSAPIEY